MCQLQEDQLEEQSLLNKSRMEPVGKNVKKNKEDKGKRPDGAKEDKSNDEDKNEDH